MKLTMTNAWTLRDPGQGAWLSLLFAGWLLLAVVAPEVVSRAFFHALIYPLTIYLLARKTAAVVWSDPFVRLFLLFCGYMAVTTWIVGDGPVAGDVQATRWGLEAALGMLAFFLWMRAVVARHRFWGRCFLILVLTGVVGGMLASASGTLLGTRLEGLGVMTHPIQGASVATVLLAVGLFLMFHDKRILHWQDTLLAVLAVIAVSTFVVLTQSRAPLISLAIYLMVLAVLLAFQYRGLTVPGIAFLVAAWVVGLIHWFVGLDVFYDQLVSRGASYRFDIWIAYLTHPPESILLGNGAGLDFRLTDASQLYLEPRGLDISHPHNIWLGAFSETGLVGVTMQAGLVLLALNAVVQGDLRRGSKIHLLAILGLFLLLTFSDEYTLLTSLHPIWLFGWLPLVFVWTWSRYRSATAADSVLAATSRERGSNEGCKEERNE